MESLGLLVPNYKRLDFRNSFVSVAMRKLKVVPFIIYYEKVLGSQDFGFTGFLIKWILYWLIGIWIDMLTMWI